MNREFVITLQVSAQHKSHSVSAARPIEEKNRSKIKILQIE